MKVFNEHQQLLIRRERRVVLGQKAVNLWLLVMVLLATFLAIAFSAGSMSYLNEKMNDPFTYWLNVYKESHAQNLANVADGLNQDSLPQHFHYDGVQTEIATSMDMLDKNGKYDLFRIQYYENMGSDLMEKVLSEENVVSAHGTALTISHNSIAKRSLGVILTIDALQRLGYDLEDVPAFVDGRVPANQADTLGFTVYRGDEKDFIRAPLPLLAVVRRLPMNKDIVASKYLNIQYTDGNYPDPFNMSKENYARWLYFFVPEEVKDFDVEVLTCIPDSLRQSNCVLSTEERIAERLRSWRQGSIRTVYPAGLPPLSVVNEIERKILDKFGSKGVQRVYNYDESQRELDSEHGKEDNGLSIHFTSLDSIRAFERYLKDKWNLQIEMTQINSKENFNAVSTLASVLTIALLLFSIISIVIFIVNMMQNYFQKVKRNLGTFKAFGISTKELMMVYVAIIVGIVLTALAIALAATWAAELLLPLFGVVKEGGAPHLILWNSNTLWAVAIIIVSTIASVLMVMHRLLRQTPGNLIYDR